MKTRASLLLIVPAMVAFWSYAQAQTNILEGTNGHINMTGNLSWTPPANLSDGANFFWWPAKGVLRIGDFQTSYQTDTLFFGFPSIMIGKGVARGDSSVAIGYGASSVGQKSVALGADAYASDSCSAAITGGYAMGPFSFAVGGGYAKAWGSNALGPYTHAFAIGSTAIGICNLNERKDRSPVTFSWSNIDPIFEVANGSAGLAGQPAPFNSNAFTVYRDGSAKVSGDLIVGGTILTPNASSLVFSAAGLERARFTPQGNLLVGGAGEIPGTGGMKIFGTTPSTNVWSGSLVNNGGFGNLGDAYFAQSLTLQSNTGWFGDYRLIIGNNGGGSASMLIDADPGNSRTIVFGMKGKRRTIIEGGGDSPDSGNDNGSNFWIRACDDEGNVVDTPFGFIRKKGGEVTIGRPFRVKEKTTFEDRVGIGTSNPDKTLTVNGGIHCKELLIDTNVFADYVFAKDYRLASLGEVEAHIQKKGHLPGVPSAQEACAKGVNVGEMQTLLLQKIEELTLYMIEQEKRIARLESENTALKRLR